MKHPTKPRQTWRAKVRDTYASLAELTAHDEIYGIARRCGFDSPDEMWQANPRIGGSTDPQAFGLARL